MLLFPSGDLRESCFIRNSKQREENLLRINAPKSQMAADRKIPGNGTQAWELRPAELLGFSELSGRHRK